MVLYDKLATSIKIQAFRTQQLIGYSGAAYMCTAAYMYLHCQGS